MKVDTGTWVGWQEVSISPKMGTSGMSRATGSCNMPPSVVSPTSSFSSSSYYKPSTRTEPAPASPLITSNILSSDYIWKLNLALIRKHNLFRSLCSLGYNSWKQMQTRCPLEVIRLLLLLIDQRVRELNGPSTGGKKTGRSEAGSIRND